MSIAIDIHDETASLTDKDFEQTQSVLQFAAERLEVGNIDTEVSVTFVDNKTIQQMNKTYRGKDAVTDVISFALEETTGDEIIIKASDNMPRMLGDIVVSVPKIKEQADNYDHSFERELGFLVVHGLLHLLGYDHMTKADEKVMFTLQEDILSAYGLKRSR